MRMIYLRLATKILLTTFCGVGTYVFWDSPYTRPVASLLLTACGYCIALHDAKDEC